MAEGSATDVGSPSWNPTAGPIGGVRRSRSQALCEGLWDFILFETHAGGQGSRGGQRVTWLETQAPVGSNQGFMGPRVHAVVLTSGQRDRALGFASPSAGSPFDFHGVTSLSFPSADPGAPEPQPRPRGQPACAAPHVRAGPWRLPGR